MSESARPHQRSLWALALRVVLLGFALYVGLWLLVTLRATWLLLFFSIILACGLSPLVERLHDRGLPRGAAVLLIYLAVILLLVLLGFMVVPPVVHQIDLLVSAAPQFDELTVDLLHRVQSTFPFLPPLDQQLLAQARQLGSQVGAIASQALGFVRVLLGVFSGLLSAVLVLLITLYLVIDGPRVRSYALSFFPADRHDRLAAVTGRMGRRMGGWLVGQVMLSLIIGAVTFVGLTVLGFQGALLLAVLAAIGEVIPIMGPILSAVPAVIVGFLDSPGIGIATLVLYLIIQQLENNLIVPKVMEQAVDIHPLAVILAIVIGGELLGVAGALLSVPFAAAAAVVLDELRNRDAPAASESVAAGASPASPG